MTPVANLRCYTAGEQPFHEHMNDQLSLVLLGDVQEQSAYWDVDIGRSMISFKPAGTRHANRWGPDGALIFSVSLCSCSNGAEPQQCGWWSPRHLQGRRTLVREYLRERNAEERLQYLWDFVALAPNAGAGSMTRPAAWLKRVRDQLREDPEETQISTLAAQLGLHRVSLARIFVDCYGIPPSVYRSRCKAMKAVTAAVTTDLPLSSAAQAGGFFDQSHASRTVKRETGLNLSDVRRLSGLH